MEFIDNYFEVEWVQSELDEYVNRKEIVYKEEFETFQEALDFYLEKKDDRPLRVRLLSVVMEDSRE